MGKECSQLVSVLIISHVEEMEAVWEDASPVVPSGSRQEGGKELGKKGGDEMERRGEQGTVWGPD